MSDGIFVSQGKNSALNITTGTVIQQGANSGMSGAPKGRLQRVIVLVAGSTAGYAYDSNVISGNGQANQLGSIPNAVGSVLFDIPFFTGLTIVPGTGQVVNVTYD